MRAREERADRLYYNYYLGIEDLCGSWWFEILSLFPDKSQVITNNEHGRCQRG